MGTLNEWCECLIIQRVWCKFKWFFICFAASNFINTSYDNAKACAVVETTDVSQNMINVDQKFEIQPEINNNYHQQQQKHSNEVNFQGESSCSSLQWDPFHSGCFLSVQIAFVGCLESPSIVTITHLNSSAIIHHLESSTSNLGMNEAAFLPCWLMLVGEITIS